MTVLLVEDDVLVRIAIAETLQDAGIAVLEAGSADEALEILGSSDAVTTLVTDVRMPGSMDGIALAHLVSRTWSGVRIIIASGHARPEEEALPEGAVFLPKPYSLRALIEAF